MVAVEGKAEKVAFVQDEAVAAVLRHVSLHQARRHLLGLPHAKGKCQSIAVSRLKSIPRWIATLFGASCIVRTLISSIHFVPNIVVGQAILCSLKWIILDNEA